MKNKTQLIIFLLFIPCLLYSTTYEVKQDGSGDYTTIQEGIDAANNGDLVLVWPGTYYENINFNSKSITVASLYHTTEDDSYKYSTIINGSQTGACIVIEDCLNDYAVVKGFTLTNGTGFLNLMGGGLYSYKSKIRINNNIICENKTSFGGGLCLNESEVELYSNSIHNNHAYNFGGGLFVGKDTQVYFDSTDKNNVYMNFAALGSDFAKGIQSPSANIVVDTFTVSNPDEHFIYSATNWAMPVDDITVDIEHGLLEQLNNDLYVDPVNGDDLNTGITYNEPLQTLSYAIKKIYSDSIAPKTIFLLEGTYSENTNNEMLPINIRSNINIVGKGVAATVFDANGNCKLLYSNATVKNIVLKGIKFVNGFDEYNGNGGLEMIHNNNIKIDSIEIINCYGNISSAMLIANSKHIQVNNALISDNIGGRSVVLNSSLYEELDISIINSIIHNSQPIDPEEGENGGGLRISAPYNSENYFHCDIINCVFSENTGSHDPMWGNGYTSGLFTSGKTKVDLVNCTFVNNEVENFDGGTVKGIEGAIVNVYNCIFYDNSPRNFYLYTNDPYGISTFNFSYSNIEGGFSQIYNPSNYNDVNWYFVNIDEEPMWTESEPYYYDLQYESPSINTATPNYVNGLWLPYIKEEDGEYFLFTIDEDTIPIPSNDLAGNPRISGGRIDMGAYEYQEDTLTEILNNNFQITNNQISVYPNPFKHNAFITFVLKEESHIKLEVINTNGQLVRAIADNHFLQGEYQLVWDGKDVKGIELNPGVYFLQIVVNNKNVTAKKLFKVN